VTTGSIDKDSQAGILSDAEIVYALINGEITVTPLLRPEQIGPTVDLRLGMDFKLKRMDSLPSFDPVDFRELYEGEAIPEIKYYETIKRMGIIHLTHAV